MVGGLIGGAIGAAAGGGKTSAAGAGSAVTASPSAVASISIEPTIEPSISPEATTPFIPQPASFELTVKTLKKQCFGSAGCIVTYRIQVAYGGPDLDPTVTYEVVYRVDGPDDGQRINTLTITGTQFVVDSEEIASTPSSQTELTAKVTSVDVLSS